MTSATSTHQRHVLVIGAHGVVGRAVSEHLVAQPDWTVTTAARRGPLEELFNGLQPPRHISLDLLDPDQATHALAESREITHLVYAGYAERSTMAAMVEPNLEMLANTLTALEAAAAALEHVVLIGGGKSYGEHLGPYKTPAKESDPRFLGPIFYNEQEDLLRERAHARGFGWTVLRPDGVFGPSTGSPMNILTSLAVFAAISRELGVPLRFPGSHGAWTALHQTTDADLLARAVEWALVAPSARDEIFNVINGDHFRWQHLWPDLAGFFDMPSAPPQPLSLQEQMSDKEPVWDRIVEKYNLRRTPYPAIASWPFVDGWLNTNYDMVQSTIKIRQAGFTCCQDTHTSLLRNLTNLRRNQLIP